MPRRNSRQPQASHIEQMTRAALLYYTLDKSQAEIADELGVSRPTVARLLQRAREEGIVEIRVNTYPGLSMQLEQKLKETFAWMMCGWCWISPTTHYSVMPSLRHRLPCSASICAQA